MPLLSSKLPSMQLNPKASDEEMKITENMKLDELAQLILPTVTTEEIEVLRGLLVKRFGGADTDDLHQTDWMACLSEALMF